MKRKTTRHSPDEVKRALARLETGQSLADVARHFDVSKSLLSYWRNQAGRVEAKQPRVPAARKSNERTRRFIERCWTSITLAFRKLDDELKREKPAGIRDLALAIAVLADKMAQASQRLHAQAAPAASAFAVSEDTWMILKRHREAQIAAPPAEKNVEPGLGVPGLEPQKGSAGDAASPAEAVSVEPDKAQRGATGSN